MGSVEVFSGVRLRKINTKQIGTTLSTRPEEVEEPVTPAGRLFMQPDLNCNILCTLGFKDSINLAEFKKTLLETLVNHKRFHSVMRKNKKGTDIWVPVDVDINAHVFEPTGYSESEMAAPHFCESYISDLSTAPPMDTSRPMWQCHILNGASGDAASHMVIRVHHSLGDGTSLMSLLLACTRRVGSPDQLPSIPTAKKKGKARPPLLTWLWSMILLMLNTIVGVFFFMSTTLWLRDSDSVIKGHEGVEKAKKKLVYEIIDLNDMRTVKDAVGGTINDVLMGMVGAGLHRYLEGRYADDTPSTSAGKLETKVKNVKSEDLKKKTYSRLAKLRIRAAALMNTRGSPGLQELALMMEGGSQMQWGNHLGYLLFPIPLKYHQDPLDHVRAAKRVSDRKKASLEGNFTYWSGSLLMGLTGPIPPTKLTRRVILQTTLTVSNVPGPMEAVTFSGNPIVNIFSTVSGHPQALCIYLQSYMGKASLIVTTAKDIIPDPEAICRHCVESLQDMVKSALATRPVGSS